MLEIRITVDAKDLSQAINNLAAAIGGKVDAKIAAPATPQQPMQVQPMQPMPVAPTPAPQPAAVPVAGAPTYTMEQIMQAGATLMDAGRMDDLTALLGKFNVQAVMDLNENQLGQFATELRALGAKI